MEMKAPRGTWQRIRGTCDPRGRIPQRSIRCARVRASGGISRMAADDTFDEFRTSIQGLVESDAEERLAEYRPQHRGP